MLNLALCGLSRPTKLEVDRKMKVATQCPWLAVFVLLAAAFHSASEQPALADSNHSSPPIEVIRDTYGVPHIFAASLADAAFGQGYCHAEDNLEPILIAYIEARGVAARTFGRARLENDFWARVFRLQDVSRRIYEGMADEARSVVDSYAAGINQRMADHPDKRPEWFDRATGLDVVAASKAYQLQQQMNVARKDLAGLSQSRRERDQADEGGGESNMWAIGPGKSRDGEVMLYSDPHLPWNGSTQWHEAHLVVGERWIYGAMFFGMPGIGIGFTQDLAWGVTNNGADTADVYRVTLHPDNVNLYRYADGWREITSETLTIELREPDGSIRKVEREVRRTHHGPILQEDRSGGVAFAVRLAGFERGNLSEAWIGYFQARSLKDLETFHDTEQPFKNHRIVADRHGDIGYYYFASTHRRSDDFQWNAPLDGANPQTEWGPPMSWREMPHIVNPPSGYLVNCNNNAYTVTTDCPLRPADYPRNLMSQKTVLTPDTRAHRAIELIESTPKLDFADLERFAGDVKTLTAEPYVEMIVKAYEQAGAREPDPDGRLKRAVAILKSWDGMATTDNQALPILATCLEVAKQGGGLGRAVQAPPQTVLRELSEALGLMEKRWGSFEVPWGKMHVIRRGDMELPIPGAGSERAADPFTSLFMAGAGKFDGEKYPVDRGSSWVQLVKCHDGAVEAKTILPYGESNDPASPHFADQTPLFASRKLKPALLTRPEIEAAATSKMTLVR